MTPAPPPPAPATAPAGLTSDLCGQASAELARLGSVIKVYGCPIAVADLDRMKLGGAQDKKEDLLRLTQNQLTDTGIFARLLLQFLDGCKTNRYPKGQAVELMGRTVGAAAPSRLMGSSMASGPTIAQGLRSTMGGAAFKTQNTNTYDRQLAELVSKCLVESEPTLKAGTISAHVFTANVAQLERITRNVDAIMVQRVFRDTLRSCKTTTALGLDALRLLSPLADAVENALQASMLSTAFSLAQEILVPVQAMATSCKAPLSAKLAQSGRSLDADLVALGALGGKSVALKPGGENAVPLAASLRSAAAAARGLDLAEQSGGFAGAVYRRVMISPKEPAAAALLAFGAIVEALQTIAAAQLLPALSQHAIFRVLQAPTAPATQAGGAAQPAWPPLRPEELTLLADRVFDQAGVPKDALPGAAGGGRGPARTLITLRGEWVARTQLLALCGASLRTDGPLQEPKRTQVKAAQSFLAGLEEKVREQLITGLYQMATGDPDQRTRQIGFYLSIHATTMLKPGLTLGPLRVAFAKYWRGVEAAG